MSNTDPTLRVPFEYGPFHGQGRPFDLDRILEEKRRELDGLYSAWGDKVARLMYVDGPFSTVSFDPEEAQRKWKALPWHRRARIRIKGAWTRARYRLAYFFAPELRDAYDD